MTSMVICDSGRLLLRSLALQHQRQSGSKKQLGDSISCKLPSLLLCKVTIFLRIVSYWTNSNIPRA